MRSKCVTCIYLQRNLCLESWLLCSNLVFFSQNPAEQVNIVIARKKDNIYKHIRRPEEGLECLKPRLVFYMIISTDIYYPSLKTLPQNIYSCIPKPELTVRSHHYKCTCQRLLPGYAYNKTAIFEFPVAYIKNLQKYMSSDFSWAGNFACDTAAAVLDGFSPVSCTRKIWKFLAVWSESQS